MTLHTSSSRTVGPFFSIGLKPVNQDDAAGPGVAGERVTIVGRVLDGDGEPVPDALIEVWQANSRGKYPHPEDTQEKPLEPNFRGFGRIHTDANGEFHFNTIKPGSVPGPDGKPQAPHIVVHLFMRGLLIHLVTRIYFPDEPANSSDYVLNVVEPARRGTLIAKKTPTAGRLEWNIRMQGLEETVFFDC